MDPQIFNYDHAHRIVIEGTVHVHLHVHFDKIDTKKLREATSELKDAVAANQPQPPVPLS